MNESTITPDRVLDCSGMTCPRPVIEASKSIKEIEVGQVLEVISTDPGSPMDMEAWSEQSGHSLIDSKQENGNFVFYFIRLS
jgi:tRNA 2-thiouridine synthesizing protein A